jgi:hypothetical protein
MAGSAPAAGQILDSRFHAKYGKSGFSAFSARQLFGIPVRFQIVDTAADILASFQVMVRSEPA